MSDITKRLKNWIESDKKEGNHTYTKFTDVDGIQLAEGMVLVHAWNSEDKRRKYYVKKDVKKNKYYLQSFFEQITHYGEYLNKEYDKVKSHGKGMGFASTNLEVELKCDYTPCFLEDYGHEPGTFPRRHSVVNGKWQIEEVKE